MIHYVSFDTEGVSAADISCGVLPGIRSFISAFIKKKKTVFEKKKSGMQRIKKQQRVDPAL